MKRAAEGQSWSALVERWLWRDFAAAGRFGQSILVEPKTALTIVRFSSSPDFAPRALDAPSAVARAVAEKPR